jgi:uncharacterized membrane protein
VFSKHRIEALSDGVFAIAMTLLVLDIKVPAETPKGHLAEALMKDAHSWISFVVTFFIASLFWTFQHRVFDLLKSVSHQMLVPTFVFLGFVSVLPFSTSLWGHHINEPLAFSVYFLNQLAIALALTVKLEIGRANGHMNKGAALEIVRFRLHAVCLVMLAAAIASYILPIQWIWPVPLAMGLLGRIIRKRREQHVSEQEGRQIPGRTPMT